MTTLTLLQRAERATKRKNKAAAARCPLFPDLYATTVEEQIERLEHLDTRMARYMQHLQDTGLAAYERGIKLRELARSLIPADVWAAKEAHFQRWHGHQVESGHAERVGGNLADIWWTALRDYSADRAVVAEHCALAHLHGQVYSYCPSCHWSSLNDQV